MVCVDAVLISWSVVDAAIIIGVDCGESDEEDEEDEEGEEDEDGCNDDNDESENKDDCGELVSTLGLGPNVIIGVNSLTNSLTEDGSLVDGSWNFYLKLGKIVVFNKDILTL